MSDRKTKFEIFQDNAGEHRWRLVSTVNGQNIDSANEGFSSAAEARNNARRTYLGLRDEFASEFDEK